ncbi:SDR family oxidoreductase [Jeotgalibacillus proteolyticus]|uniref:SDR family oxidoreductase n=1 Tax=Jeotgalibacillus proteolyticus TaxID=2082395 RepID=UPI003CF14617
MTTLITGFNGKTGFEVAKKAKSAGLDFKCAVRDTEKAQAEFGSEFSFTLLDFTLPETFVQAFNGVDRIFLIYPPGEGIEFERFVEKAKELSIKQIVYLSIKDVQFMPFIHHFKNEKLIKKTGIPYTFIRAGYFMQNLNDFLLQELKERQRIFVPAGKGKTSFVDARDLADIAVLALTNPSHHHNKSYVITGNEALSFYEAAERMTTILQLPIVYTDPSVKEFKQWMLSQGADPSFINIVTGIHFPTKLGLAKGISDDFEKVTGKKPSSIDQYIADFKQYWL